jgi:hypothetical protein
VLVAAIPLGVWKFRHQPKAPPPPYTFPSAEIAALDRVVQARFAVTPDNDFGMGRIGKRHEYFEPVSEAEQNAMQGLGQAKQEVAFYVVSRNVIRKQRTGYGQPPVQGPIYMKARHPIGKLAGPYPRAVPLRFYTHNEVPANLPSDDDVTAVGSRLFNEPELASGMTSKIGSWKVVAVPIPASSQSCLDCHNMNPPWKRHAGFFESKRDYIELGDMLGTAVYCYRAEQSDKMGRLEEDLRNLKLKFHSEPDSPGKKPAPR